MAITVYIEKIVLYLSAIQFVPGSDSQIFVKLSRSSPGPLTVDDAPTHLVLTCGPFGPATIYLFPNMAKAA